jgi:multidrug transporter EmrE-like cation transporter
MDQLAYIFILLSTVSSVFAQYLFKLSYKNNDYRFISFGIILYAFVGYCSFKVLKYLHLGVANVISHIFYFILLFIVSYLFLNENLTKKQIIASVIGIVSLALFITDHH